LGAFVVPMSFRMSFFFVEIPASKVVKKNNKNEMSKTFFIFSSIPNDLFFGESYIYHYLGCFTRMWGVYLEGV
jgi:hypothetical protein